MSNKLDKYTYTSYNANSLWSVVYRYPEGRMVVLMEYIITLTTSNSWGSLYYAGTTMPDFPIAFSEIPFVQYSLHTSGPGQDVISICEDSNYRPSKINPGGYFIYSPVIKNITAKIDICADGRNI